MKKISFLFLFCCCLFSCSKLENENNVNEISVTGHAENITAISADILCYANFPKNVFGDVKVGIQIDDKQDITNAARTELVPEVGSDGKYTIQFLGLQPQTKYYFRSFVSQNGSYHYGKTKQFSTTGDNVVMLYDPELLSSISARFTMLVNSKYSKREIGKAWLIYSKSDTFSDKYNSVDFNNTTATIYALSPKTTYYCQAYIRIDDAIYRSNIISFITPELDVNVSINKTEVNNSSVSFWGSISGLDGWKYKDMEVGILYDIQDDFDKSPTSVKANYSNGTFMIEISSITANTKYYYKPYIILDDQIFYGETSDFMIEQKVADAIDLGLSVKWASWNLRATKPEGIGAFYAWGETLPKLSYTWENYTFYDKTTQKVTKYCSLSECGKIDNKKTLELVDDAANFEWGGNWRIPTQKECEELIENTRITEEEINGQLVMRFTAKNGKSIVFPKAGIFGNFYEPDAHSGYSYWTSSLSRGDSMNAYLLDIYKLLGVNTAVASSTTETVRRVGFQIRAVTK